MSSGLVNFIQNEIEQTMLQNCTFACISLEKLAETVDRIEKLEAAIEDMAQYISRADWMQLKKDTHEVWDLGGIND
jgi:hypothetical protein